MRFLVRWLVIPMPAMSAELHIYCYLDLARRLIDCCQTSGRIPASYL